MDRWQSLEPERKEQILGAALVEFGARGWDGASMQRIAEGARLSKGLLYYYFEGREGLFAWCLLQLIDEIERHHGGWPALVERDSFWEELRSFWDRVMTLAFERPELMQALRSFMRELRGLDLGPAFAPLQEYMERFQVHAIKQGQSLGLIREDMPVDLIMNMMSAVDEALDLWAFSSAELSRQRLLAANAHRVDSLRRLLSP